MEIQVNPTIGSSQEDREGEESNTTDHQVSNTGAPDGSNQVQETDDQGVTQSSGNRYPRRSRKPNPKYKNDNFTQ